MKNKLVSIIALLGLVGFITGCSSGSQATSSTSATSTIESSEEHSSEKHLDYDDQDDWEFTAGHMQSPINIPSSDVTELVNDSGTITLDYSQDVISAENNGHSIQVSNGGTALINGRNFTLTQFHFHAESEHTIDGSHYPIEAHFVNTAQDGRIAVIGVFFEKGEENKGFQEVLDDVNNGNTDPITDLDDMIPNNKSYYHYLGSLTTPPLVENVEWYIFKNPVTVSSEQIESFKTLYSHNNREIQPLNDRVITEHNE